MSMRAICTRGLLRAVSRNAAPRALTLRAPSSAQLSSLARAQPYTARIIAESSHVRAMSTKPASEAEEAQAKAEGSEEPSKEEAKEEVQAEEPEPELSLEEQQQLQIEELQGARDEMENRWKRAMADSENARQQAKREIASAKKFAVQAFAKSMLDVGDTLQLAIEHTPEDQRVGDANPPLKALFEGVEMTEKILMQNLEKHGVTRFNPVNEVPECFHPASRANVPA